MMNGNETQEPLSYEGILDALRESEHRYRAMFENMKSGVAVYQPVEGGNDFVFKDINKAAERISRIRKEDVIGKSLLEILPNIVKSGLLTCLRGVCQTGKPEHLPAYHYEDEQRQGWRENFIYKLPSGEIVVIYDDVTETKTLLKELSESNKSYQSLYRALRIMCDNVPDLIWAKDMNKLFTFANRAVCEKLLNAQDTVEPIGKTDLFFAHRERAKHPDRNDWHTFGEICRDSDTIVMDSRRPDRFNEFGNVKGEFLYLDVHKAPFVNEQGELIGTVGCGRDVTRERQLDEQRKLMEEGLRESRKNFRTFFETMDDIMLVATADGKIVYSNSATLRKLGYCSEELRQMHVLDLHPREKLQEAEKIFTEMFRGERDVCPLPLAKKDGSYLPVETRVWFGKWSGKDCIFGICKDLSREQEALQKFNRVFDSNPAPMAVSSYPERKFTDVNSAFVTITGFSKEDVIGRTSQELGLFVEPEKLASVSQALRANGNVRDVELKTRKKNGTIADGLFFGEIIDSQGEKSLLSVMIDVSYQKRLEDQLRQAAQRFKTVADLTWAWEYWIRPDGSLSYISPSCERITGYHPVEFLNNPKLIQEIVHPDDRSLVSGHLDRVNTDIAHNQEFRIVSRSGETRWIEHECQAVRGERGQWLGRRASNRDITDRKNMEERLRRVSAYNRTLIETSLDALVTIDAEGKITDVNSATEMFTGRSRNELIGTDFSDYFTDTEKARAVYQQVFKDSAVRDYELKLRHKRGTVTIVLYNASVYRDESGKVMGVFAAARDITGLKEAEQKLLELNETLENRVAERSVELLATNSRLLTEIQGHAATTTSLRDSETSVRTILESSPVGIFVIRDQQYSFVNQAFMKIVGLADKSDVIGQNHETPYADDCAQNICDMIRQCRDRSEMITVKELKVTTHDHREHYLNIWIQPISLSGSLEIIGFIIDVADEIELRRHLNQTQKMQALGSLASGIAHDFNNVLFAITGYTELALSSTPSDSKTNSQLKQVLEAAGRASDLVKQILTFSREVAQEKKPLLLGPIVKESLNFLRASITSNIEIRRNIGANLHAVNADPTQIHQIIMNLVTNAYHSMKNTGGYLHVGLEEFELCQNFVKTRPNMAPGTYQKLSVSDTGHGMSQETLERIFEPYFTTKELGQGTGLGLSVVDSIVRDHGGVMNVDSAPGKGTTFEIYFPTVMETHISPVKIEPDIPFGKGSILFVDDENMVTDATKLNLESLGYKVTTENDPVRALETFESQPHAFDLIITDMSMPKMTGLEFSSRVSLIRKDIPILMITGFSDLLEGEHFSEYGIRDILHKPLKKAVLAQTVSRILSEQKS
jgi:PAS domain S-box-containing protein